MCSTIVERSDDRSGEYNDTMTTTPGASPSQAFRPIVPCPLRRLVGVYNAVRDGWQLAWFNGRNIRSMMR